ncbi:hypothetical protein K8R66_01910 [bacterium]|nr:hypothetical protein [bacterium]
MNNLSKIKNVLNQIIKNIESNKYGFNIDDCLLIRENSIEKNKPKPKKKYPKIFKNINLDIESESEKINIEEKKKNIIGNNHYLKPKQ